jgi:cysteine synthase A
MQKTEGVCRSIIDVIGNTPLVELRHMTADLDGRILAKLEYLNPGSSKKDRIALQMITDAEQSGALAPGQTVVELTSGNTGTGLAIVCRQTGHPFIAVMSRGNSIERARMMTALGAEVILVDQLPESTPGKVSGGDLDLVEQETRRLVKARKAFRADQFELDGGCEAHYLHTGPEILRQTDGQFDVFCDFVGTGGSFGGCAKAFKEADPHILCYVVEPEGAAPLSGQPVRQPSHPIQGGGYSRKTLTFVRPEYVDGYLQVSGQEAIAAARALARDEGIFAGFSSGANVAAALKLLRGEHAGKTIVVIMCDSGLKYLSTDLYDYP